jgi:hypothetical protein
MRLLVLEVSNHAGALLRDVGHDVTTCATLAGMVECLMRDSRFELILIDAARDERLLDDAARYAHWYAPAATLIALGDAPVAALPFPIQIATVLDVPAL